MKKILVIIVALLLIGYLIISADYFRKLSLDHECSRLEIVIQDSVKTQFVTLQEVLSLVKKHDLYPVGKSFREINTLEIRDSILTNKLVADAHVYTTPRGSVVAKIKQREPVLRVISSREGSFYIDKERKIMPVSPSFAVYVPIATGEIDEEMAKGELFDFAMFLNNNTEWDAWIEQIIVKANREVELIPRAGDFKIILGELDNYPEKLNKFVRFADEGLNVVGWNRYSEINLKYDNQVVCTRIK